MLTISRTFVRAEKTLPQLADYTAVGKVTNRAVETTATDVLALPELRSRVEVKEASTEKAAVVAAGYSIDDVASMCMVEVRVLRRIEDAQQVAEPFQVEAFARIYGVSVEYLRTGDTEQPALRPAEGIHISAHPPRSKS